MVIFGQCIHCGVIARIAAEVLYFAAAGKEIQLELCVDCRAMLLADVDITRADTSL